VRRFPKSALASALVVSGCTAPNGPSTAKESAAGGPAAVSADALVDSVGVNIHLSYSDTAYDQFDEVVVPALRRLGVRHVRDGIEDEDCQSERQQSLAASGVHLTGVVPYSVDSIPSLIECIRAQADVLVAVEGPNETDEFDQFEYNGQGFPDGAIAFMRDFYPAMKADAQLGEMPVYQTTLAFPQNEPDGAAGQTRAGQLGDLSEFADFGNSHNYFSGGDPPGAVIPTDHLPFVEMITPGKPYVSTEGGYSMGDGDGYKGGWGDGQSAPFDEDVQARYVTRYVLEMLRNGYSRSFLYELIDIDDPQWGLFRADGSPKPAADALGAMLSLLSEGRWDEASGNWQTPDFTPRPLDYQLSEVPDSVHSLLAQKSNGTHYVILWNEVKNWDTATGQPVDVDPVAATLTLNGGPRSMQTFVPTDSGAQATSQSTGRSIDLQVLDRPVIVELTPPG
jgi:hypothetical protein